MTTPEKIGKYRWIICALLFFATTINYIDRQILSLIKGTLDEQLHWTNQQFGWTNSAFQGAYGISLLAFGWLVDRYGTKFGYTLSIVIWSLSAMCHAFVGSVGGFIAARIALGLGEGGNFPTAIKAVALWFPKRERAFSTSLFNSGANVGALLAPMLVPLVVSHFGWKSAFVLAGVIGFIWLGFWIRYYEIPDRVKNLDPAEHAFIHSDEDEKAADAGAKPAWISLLGYKQAWSFIIAKFLTDPVWWFFLIWLPDFFKIAYGLEIKNSWVHLVTIYSIVTVLSIGGGWITGFLTQCGWSVTRARKSGMLFFALWVVPVYFATKVTIWPAVFLIALAGAGHQAFSANLFTSVSDMFPKKAVGSLIGMGGLAGSAGGMLFPVFCGWMLDRFKDQHNEVGAYTILLHICAFAYVVTFVINHWLAPKFVPIKLTVDKPAVMHL
jgi:ACS family hexuronate transporter-like MFS transporter